MDNNTLGAAIGILAGLPGSDISRAEAAATRAEEAAEAAASRNYGIEITGTKLIISERSDD